jgi:chorismate--pyruvate lyase
MTPPAASVALHPARAAADVAWLPLEACTARAPSSLLPWLSEPGLLTARVRASCGAATQFRMLRLAPAPLALSLKSRLAIGDDVCLLREIEFACAGERWIFAQSVFPESTVARYPWLRGLGESPLGEALRRVGDVERDALEYAELPADCELACAAQPAGGDVLWARRAVYRLAGSPIIVQEVFLPALGRCCGQEDS